MREKTKLLGGGGREWRRARSWLLQLLYTLLQKLVAVILLLQLLLLLRVRGFDPLRLRLPCRLLQERQQRVRRRDRAS